MKWALAIKMKGGLGNQLFQYATGRALCIQFNISRLFFDVENYNNESLERKFSLSNFNIKGKVIKSKRFQNIFNSNTRLNNIAQNLTLHRRIEEKGFVIQQINSSNSSMLTTLAGYWQSDHYFKSIRTFLLKELTPVHIPPFPGWISRQDTVAIHVRRTDYLTEERYGFLGKSYYTNAIAVLKEKLKQPGFVFFSDDLAWCKAAFANEDCIFFEERDWAADHLQLYLMSRCSHQVIANSSFSWWAAWLNDNADKIVIRPEKPFMDDRLLYEAHYPDEWIICSNN